MRISEMFGKGKTVLSFEVFPPKKTSSIQTIYDTLEKLSGLRPDYISVTYGAGGNLANNSTCEIASAIRNKYGIESMAHITCVNCTKSDVTTILDRLKVEGIENVLALRGDINPDIPPKTDFRYASELVEFIRSYGGFGIAGACYPEVHYEAPDMITDIRNLRKKVDMGAQTLVTQLFFDNSVFYDFREKARIAGINVPISAGIMPVTNKNQIERMVTMCGASLPQKFSRMIQRYENNPEALVDAGIAYATDQIVDLLANGVDGIHLYTMNNPYVAGKISESIGKLL